LVDLEARARVSGGLQVATFSSTRRTNAQHVVDGHIGVDYATPNADYSRSSGYSEPPDLIAPANQRISTVNIGVDYATPNTDYLQSSGYSEPPDLVALANQRVSTVNIGVDYAAPQNDSNINIAEYARSSSGCIEPQDAMASVNQRAEASATANVATYLPMRLFSKFSKANVPVYAVAEPVPMEDEGPVVPRPRNLDSHAESNSRSLSFHAGHTSNRGAPAATNYQTQKLMSFGFEPSIIALVMQRDGSDKAPFESLVTQILKYAPDRPQTRSSQRNTPLVSRLGTEDNRRTSYIEPNEGC
jgi:hypothetical protein